MSESAQPAEPRPSDAIYYAIALAAGAVVGLIGSYFHLGTVAIASWITHLKPVFSGGSLILASSVTAAIMVVAAVWLVRTFCPEAAGSGVQEIEGAMEGLRTVRWKRILPVKFVGGLLALGSGLVAGREGPTIHMGASVAQAASDWFRLPVRDTRGLLAAGGAAGLAAAFNAPLAAILFVIEETRRQFPYGFRTYTAVILGSFASAVVCELITGTSPALEMFAPKLPLVWLPAFFGLGIVLGVVGVLFNKALIASLDTSLKIGRRWSPYLVPLVVGAAIGALLILRPEATGGGEVLVIALAQKNLPLAALAIVVVIRFVMTMFSYSTGVPGGIFAPILALATSIGLLYATVLQLALPLPEGAQAAFAIAAMGGLFSSTVRAPLVGMVLVAELTGAYTLLVPVILTCVTANIVAEALGGRPIYEVLLERTLRLAGLTPPPADAEDAVGGWDARERIASKD
ncbi:H(+)/Cl(-) exchange transporter ClcA [Segnochrobactrum spirostomi]|uniref:H(+)/Cl(-) exchange transporter ClcA n=1 Tax=Segnochrobactrum spirostomi TaxID=2608987 RepID=UPI0028AB7EB7|nr:H(+)/Cl(-) exchange transporter ClcA [Segnochrobactrum spirostomi]